MTARVLKFGGSSVADAERVDEVVEIVAAEWREHAGGPFVVVVSALGGVTDALDRQCDTPDRSALRVLAERHRRVAADLGMGAAVTARLEETLDELRRLVRGLSLIGACEPRVRARVLSLGEALSSAILAGALERRGVDTELVDARELIVTDAAWDEAPVDRATTERRIRSVLGGFRGVAVVPGFAGATGNGTTTLLGRGGSDYTAALIGGALRAESIEIWTDVEGIMSADPSLVPEAVTQRRLTFDEVAALARLGAKVMHGPAVQPARDAGVPLVVRSTRAPHGGATWVTDPVGDDPAPEAVLGVTAVRDVVRLALPSGVVDRRGAGPGGWLDALAGQGTPPLLTLTDSGSTVVVLRRCDARRALDSVGRDARPETSRRWRVLIESGPSLGCVSVVGRGIGRSPAVVSGVFAAAAEADVRLHGHGCDPSGSSISLIVAVGDADRAVAALHGALLPARPQGTADPAKAMLGVGAA